jgi:hypothetical protein
MSDSPTIVRRNLKCRRELANSQMSKQSSQPDEDRSDESPTGGVSRLVREAASVARPRLAEMARAAKAAADAGQAAAKRYTPRAERFAQTSVEAATRKVEATAPEVKRLARQAKPHLERAGQEALSYFRKHEKEIVMLGGAIARSAAPRPVRRFIALIDTQWRSDADCQTEETRPRPRPEG